MKRRYRKIREKVEVKKKEKNKRMDRLPYPILPDSGLA